MADKNVPSEEAKNSKLKVVESKSKKTAKKAPMSFKQILTIIIIVVLAMLMVGGVYYVVVLISQSRAEKANAWGYYDGEPILIEQNNVFYNTLTNDESLQNAYLSGDYNALLQSYYTAYQAQVVYQALSKEAKKAGIVTTQNLVNDIILTAGVFNDENGNFSEEIYDNSTDAQKHAVNTYYTNYYPYNQVLVDHQLSIVSKGEADFINEVAKQTRQFDYFVIDYNAYPTEKAVEYGKSNSNLFDTGDFSVLTTASEENIKAAHDALVAGTSWEDVVSTYSEDAYKSKNGHAGELMMFSIMTNLSNTADIDVIRSLKVGTFTKPIQSPNGYTIYKLDAEIKAANFDDKETISAVKYYIQNNSIDDVNSYIETASTAAAELAKTDFEGAAKSVNSDIATVGACSNNIGNSTYLGGISSYDTVGYLASAANGNEAVVKELFGTEEGHVAGPFAVQSANNTYVVAEVVNVTDSNESNAYITTSLYAYYAPLQTAYDTFYNVLSSDAHTDNFYTQFFSTVLGNTASTSN